MVVCPCPLPDQHSQSYFLLKLDVFLSEGNPYSMCMLCAWKPECQQLDWGPSEQVTADHVSGVPAAKGSEGT